MQIKTQNVDYEKLPTIQEIFKRLKKKKGEILPSMENEIDKMLTSRAYKIRAYLEKRSYQTGEICECGHDPASKEFGAYIHNSAYNEDYETFYLCSDDCRDAWEEDTFFCQGCSRQIVYSCGHNSHYREMEGEIICIKCYMEILLEQGLEFERESLENGSLPGLFFSGDNSELHEVNFEEFDKRFISGSNSKETAKEVLELMKDNLVIVAYENLSILGDEGHISIWIKPKEKEA